MSGVHVVILAAGKGSRLGALGERTPKWLLQVGARTIADHQLEALERAGRSVASVRVVTGHAHQAIEEFVAGHGDVMTVYNPLFAALNNWYSVLLALRSIDEPEPRVAVINADLFARSEWIAAFMRAAAETDHEALIAVDRQRELTDESMKVNVEPGDGDRLHQIGKVGTDDPVGEYVGMLAARGDALRAFRAALETFEGDPARANEWYERGVGLTAAGGSRWQVWATPDGRWVEIDDDGDHARAVRMADEA